MSFERLEKREWETEVHMTNDITHLNIVKMKDLAQVIKRRKAEGKKPKKLQPLEPWVIIHAMEEAKELAETYGCHLMSIKIKRVAK